MTQILTNPTSADSAADAPAPARDVMIRCAGLTKVFRDFWMRSRVRAVDNLDLEIRSGEVFGLLGPNGSGKSTTIKMILGLLNPTAGRIAIMGKRPEDVGIKRQIGYLPEESYLYRFLNARETLEYYGRLFHQSRVQRRRRIDMLLEMVGLEAVQRRPVGEYSKGMQRRIGLAQALINDPQLLILDEPTTGLDPIGTRQIKDIIVSLAERGKTVLLCSHLLGDVEDVCDRVSIMFGGKIRAQGTVDELLVKRDVTSIETETLDDATVEEVEQLLRKHGKAINRVDRPRQRLESLFLEIVEKAQAEGVTTSGARAGGKMAQFLLDGDETDAVAEGNAQVAAVIEDLMGKTQSPAEPPADKAGDEPDDQPRRETDEVLSQLTGGGKIEPPSPKPRPAEAAPSNDPALPPAQEADLDVIQGLVQPAGKPSSKKADQASAQPTSKAKPTPKVAPPAAPAPAPQPKTDAGKPEKPSTPPPASKPKKSKSGESPDQQFIKALDEVPEFEEDENQGEQADDKSDTR